VNGTMVVGRIEQAKANAFQRDLAAGSAPTGISPGGLEAAVITAAKEKAIFAHYEAVQEFRERIGAENVQVKAIKHRPPALRSRRSHDAEQREYPVPLSGGVLRVSMPRTIAPDDLPKVQSFLNWAYRGPRGKVDLVAPPPGILVGSSLRRASVGNQRAHLNGRRATVG
jgi:hypothetical protein